MLLKLLNGHHIGYIEPKGTRIINGCLHCSYACTFNDWEGKTLGVHPDECVSQEGKISYCIDNAPLQGRHKIIKVVSMYKEIVDAATTPHV